MKIDILTLFPEMFEPLNKSILGRAQKNGILTINTVNIRDFSLDKHKKCDDYAFGGGAGMLMMPQPVCDAFDNIDPDRQAFRVYMSPKGRLLNQTLVKELAAKKHLIVLCGHYEGVDQRALDLNIDMEVSVGDFVVTGGEIPALLLIDSVSRYVDGVLGSDESTKEETFTDNLLEYPQYTRPAVFRGLSVPQVLLDGNHKEIEEWRKSQSVKLTKQLREDLAKDNTAIAEYENNQRIKAEKQRLKELKKLKYKPKEEA
jgi:tRNA (guanine37-N1)-methyltransferase